MVITPFKVFLLLVQKRFLKTSSIVSDSLSPPPSPSSSFTVQYLTHSCGFPLQTALLTSKKLELDKKKSVKYESLVQFLKSYGFSDTHLVKLITRYPAIFHCRVEQKLKPKFQYLIGVGFVGSLLPEIIFNNPLILTRGLSSHIKPSVEILKKHLDTDEKVVAAIMRGSWLLTSCLKGTMQKNIELLKSEGMPIENVSKLLLKQPRVLLQRVDKVVSGVNAVKKLGVQPDSGMFPLTLHVMSSTSDSSWKRKLDFFTSLGWSEEDITRVLRRLLHCFACSEEKIERAMEFYINTLKLEREFVINYPIFLTYSMNKRVLPRYTLYKFLESKGLVESNKKFVWVLMESEANFLKKYVSKYHNEFPNLMEIYGSTNKANK